MRPTRRHSVVDAAATDAAHAGFGPVPVGVTGFSCWIPRGLAAAPTCALAHRATLHSVRAFELLGKRTLRENSPALSTAVRSGDRRSGKPKGIRYSRLAKQPVGLCQRGRPGKRRSPPRKLPPVHVDAEHPVAVVLFGRGKLAQARGPRRRRHAPRECQHSDDDQRPNRNAESKRGNDETPTPLKSGNMFEGRVSGEDAGPNLGDCRKCRQNRERLQTTA